MSNKTELGKILSNQEGQTTIEYILLMGLVAVVAVLVWNKFGSYMTDTFGEFNQQLSSSLSTGTCNRNCFFQGYANAKK
jgi:Flp pilus assembly pilin Flp